MLAIPPRYPSREPFYAHRLTRLLFKSCAAQSIGHHAVMLIIHIAHTEDAARYQGPVRFWNSQLSETLGFTSPKQLNDCRQAAIDAGWLHYEREDDRKVGHYWTMIPPSVSGHNDQPIEETIHSPNGTENGKRSELGTQKGTEVGTHSGTGSGKPSNPVPIPCPKDVVVVVDDSFSFGSFLFGDIRIGANKLRNMLPKNHQEEFRDLVWQIAFVALKIEGPKLIDQFIRSAERNANKHLIDYLEGSIKNACVDRGFDWHKLKLDAPECPTHSPGLSRTG